ncbi:Hypothetical protein POVN_LOCUS360 [uncultured virus]|nr:Hypothetical protein POVN_LOCUS360 [uncultured virus]
MKNFNTLISQREDLVGKLGTIRGSLKNLARGTNDPQKQALEEIVLMETRALDVALAQAEQSWSHRVASGSFPATDPKSKEQFINGLSSVYNAREKLRKTQDKLSNWKNKNSDAKSNAEFLKFKEQEHNVSNEIANLDVSIPAATLLPFFELYTVLQDYRMLPIADQVVYRDIEPRLIELRKHVNFYEDSLAALSAYIPREKHKETYQRMLAERKEAARALAAMAQAAKATTVLGQTNSVLGQLFVSNTGAVVNAVGTQLLTPQHVIKATVSSTGGGLPLPVEEDNFREPDESAYDDGDGYDQYYGGSSGLNRYAGGKAGRSFGGRRR